MVILGRALAFAQNQQNSTPLAPATKPAGEDILGMHLKCGSIFKKIQELNSKIINIENPKTFFVYWLPDGFENQTEKQVMVLLHGAKGNAYERILAMSETASEQSFGLVAIQWGWPIGKKNDFEYLNPGEVYEIISSALEFLETNYKVNKHLSAWYGFSRASRHCPIYAFLDKKSGKNYFNLFIAASGSINPETPPVPELLTGKYGENPIRDSHFYLWAGVEDLKGKMPQLLEQSKQLIEKLGGIVDIFRVGAGGHGNFDKEKKYQLEAVVLWRELKKDLSLQNSGAEI